MLLKSKIDMADCTYFEFLQSTRQNRYVLAPVRPINIRTNNGSDWAVFVEDNEDNRGQKYPSR